ncbi:hypothetical protein TNCV_1986401 [Trichonephila clavipes]|nr:hypothetical protein TNCV_1986401 [Trichonephila clavipes]
MDPSRLCPDKGLVLLTLHIDTVSAHTRFLLLSLSNNETSRKSSFAIQKAIQEISGEPKSVKNLRFVTKSSTTTQANLLPSTSSATFTTSSESQPHISVTDTALTTSNSLSTSAASS